MWFLAIWRPSWIHANISVIPKTILLDFDTELTKDPYNWKISQKFLLQLFLGKASILGSLTLLLIFQCFKISYSCEKLHNEIHKDIFKRNRYPNDFVDFCICIKKSLDKLYITEKIYQTVEKKQLLIIPPFLGHLSLEGRNIPSCSLRIVFQSTTRLSSSFKFKDSIPKYLCSHHIF